MMPSFKTNGWKIEAIVSKINLIADFCPRALQKYLLYLMT